MLKEYLPEFLHDNKHFSELMKSESKELVDSWDKLEKATRNQFIETANEEGIARYESIASIHSKASEGLEFRRSRLMSKFSTMTPYNKYWLKGRLNAVLGENKHEHDIKDDLLTIKTSTEDIENIRSLRKELRQDIPCTMDMNFGLVRTSQQPMHMGAIARVGKITTITPSTEVKIDVSSNHKMYAGSYVRTVKKITIQGG